MVQGTQKMMVHTDLKSGALFAARYKDKGVRISVGDIYQTVEDERCNSRQKSLGDAVTSAHFQSRYGNSYRREFPHDRLSLPSLSRSETRMETESVLSLPAVLDNKVKKRNIVSAPTTFSSSRVCLRTRSALNREVEGLASSLSRQCCEVLGPHLCNQCAVIRRRQHDCEKHEMSFDTLYVSEENFATSAILQKCLPNLNPYQIQTKLARGEISRDGLRQRIIRKDQTAKKIAEEARKKQIQGERLKAAKTAQTFFTNIRDLNTKISSGQMTKKLVDPKGVLAIDVKADQKRTERMSFSELLNPVFLSPKRVREEPKPTYVAYYEPPLVPKVCQNAEPAFFAGSETHYSLPDRLPEKAAKSDSEEEEPISD